MQNDNGQITLLYWHGLDRSKKKLLTEINKTYSTILNALEKLTWSRFLFILFLFVFCKSRFTFSISSLLFTVYLFPFLFLIYSFLLILPTMACLFIFWLFFVFKFQWNFFFFVYFLFSKIHWFVLINLFIYTQRDANHPDGTSKVSFTITSHIPFANWNDFDWRKINQKRVCVCFRVYCSSFF